jgi:hypothetical protein
MKNMMMNVLLLAGMAFFSVSCCAFKSKSCCKDSCSTKEKSCCSKDKKCEDGKCETKADAAPAPAAK